MTKHQLRIGNKVKVFGKIYTIKELGEFEAAMEETEGVFVYSDVQGVELTGELLIGCGFENIGEPFRRWISDEIGIDITEGPDSNYFARFIKRYRKDGNRIYVDRNGPFIEMIFCPRPINSLHNLMNLWRDLTGAELTINLEQVTP